MARFLVEILINAAGGPKARASFDDIGSAATSSAKKVQDAGLQSERALRRTAEAAERLKDQMEETKASKGLIADLGTLNARLKEQIAALNGDSAALSRYEQKEKEAAQAQRILTAQVKAGVSAQSTAGKEIADAIRLHDRYQDELHQTARALAQAQGGGGRISGVISTAGSFINTATAITATLVGLGYSVKHLTDAASESEGVLAQLRAGLESTGGASGQTISSLEDLASSLSRLSGQDDELIASAESILLTFTKVSGEVFPAATAAALDMSVRMKQDLNSSILLVGKALNDPIKGVTALTKSGIQFTSSQKEQIKTLVESGRLFEAQGIILKELQTQFGGSAAAARDTLGGALSAVRVETGNLIEVLAGSLSPVIRELAEDYIHWAQSAEAQQEIAEWGNLLADAVRAIATASELAAPALKLLGMEAKVFLAVLTKLLEMVGWVGEKIQFAGRTYLEWARDAGILKAAITESTPQIQTALQTQLDAVFNLREEYGKLGQAAIQAAQDQMSAMEAESAAALTQAQRNRELLKTREETRKKNAQIGTQKDTGPNEADRELLRQTIELEKHAANLNNIITRQTIRLNEHAEAARKSAGGEEELTDAVRDAIQTAKERMAELEREAKEAEQSATSIRISTEEHKKSTLAQKQEAEVRKIRAGLQKVNRDLTEQEIASINSWVARTEKANEITTTWVGIRKKLAEYQKPIDLKINFEIKGTGLNNIGDVIKYLDELEKVRVANQTAIDEHNQAIYDDLMDQALQFKDSLRTPKEALEDFQARITELEKVVDSAGNTVLKAVEVEKIRNQAIADYTNERFRAQTSALRDFFDTLSDEFGGLFSYISDLIASVQKGGDFGSSVGQIAGMMGAKGEVGYGGYGGSGAVGAAAGVGSAVYVWWQLYKTIDGLIKDSKTRNYGTRVDYQSTGGIGSMSYLSEQGEGAAKAIRDAINSVAEALGGSVVDLPSLALAIRNDGKRIKAYIGGELIGIFGSVQDAIDAAIRTALTDPRTNISGLNDLMKQYLSRATAGVDLDELMGTLGKLREIGDMGMGDLLISYREGTRHIESLRQSLLLLDQSSQAVIDATNQLNEAQRRLYEGTRNQLLGIDSAAVEALRNLQGFQAGISDVGDAARAGLEAQIAQAKRQLDVLNRKETGLPNNGMGGGGVAGPRDAGTDPSDITRLFMDGLIDGVDSEKARLQAAISDWEKQLGQIPKALTKEELNLAVFTAFEQDMRKSGKYAADIAKFEKMRVDLRYKELKLQLITMGLWEEWAKTWESLYKEATSAAGRAPGGGGRGHGGGGGTDRKQMREDLQDEISRIQAQLRGPLYAALFDFNKQIEDFTKRAKEAKLPAADVAAGIAAITAQFRKSIREQAETWAGRGTDFSRRLKEMQDFFNGLRDLGKQSGMGKREIDQLEREALGKFGQDLQAAIAEFGGLTNPMLAIQMQAQTLRTNLLAFAEAAGWSAEQIAAAQADIDAGVEYQRQQGINSLLDRLFDWMDKAGIQTKDRIEHERRKALLDIQLIEAQLRFFGALDATTQGWIDGVRDWINGPDFGGGLKDALEDFTKKQSDWWSSNFGGDSYNNLVADAQEMLKRYQQDGLSPLERELKKINEDFTKIMGALGATPEVLQAREDAIQRAIMNAMEGLQNAYDSILNGPGSGLTAQSQFANTQSDYDRILQEVRSGDFTHLGDLGGIVQKLSELGISQYGSSTGGYQDLRTRLLTELGPILSGAGLNINQILSGSGPQSMAATLSASNDNNTLRLITTHNDNTSKLRNAIETVGNKQADALADVALQLSLLRTGTGGKGGGFGYGN